MKRRTFLESAAGTAAAVTGFIGCDAGQKKSVETAPAQESFKLAGKTLEEFRDRYSGPYLRAASGGFHDVIEPRETRLTLIKAFEMFNSKKVPPQLPKKHGNIPL